MVRRTNTPVSTRPRPTRFPPHHVMTEAEAFTALRDEIQAFREENQLLRDRLAALEDERSRTQPTPPPPPIPTPPPAPFKEPKIGEPPTFDGKTSEFPSFLHQCKLYIRMKPVTFREHDDESRVAFIISRLRGVPAEWGQALFESNSPLLTDYEAFLERLVILYQNKERRTQLEDKLARLKQTGSASAFAAEFTTLCEILGYPLDTRMGDFRLKLKPVVQNALALLPAPLNYEELVERVVRLDHAQYSLRKSENANNHHFNASSNNKPSQRQQSAPPSSHSKHPTQQNASASHASTTWPSAPSSHPRGPISQEEREHRVALKLCMYCADPGHAIQDCPNLHTAVKKGYAKPRVNTPAASSISSVSTTSLPTSSTITFVPPSPGNPPPQGSTRQDH